MKESATSISPRVDSSRLSRSSTSTGSAATAWTSAARGGVCQPCPSGSTRRWRRGLVDVNQVSDRCRCADRGGREDSEGLDLLSDVVGNLQIDDATQRTAILEDISEVFAQVNRTRASADRKPLSRAAVPRGHGRSLARSSSCSARVWRAR